MDCRLDVCVRVGMCAYIQEGLTVAGGLSEGVTRVDVRSKWLEILALTPRSVH